MEPARFFTGRNFSPSPPSMEIPMTMCWSNPNRDRSHVPQSHHDDSQIMPNPFTQKRMEQTISDVDFSRDSRGTIFTKFEPDPTKVAAVFPNTSSLYQENIYGSMLSSSSACAIPTPTIGDRDHRFHPYEWQAPFSSTPVQEWLRNNSQVEESYTSRGWISNSFYQDASQQQQQQQQQQRMKQSANESSSLGYEFTSGSDEEQTTKDRSFQFLEDIFMEQSFGTPDTSKEQLPVESVSQTPGFPLLEADSAGYLIQDESSSAHGFRYNTSAEPNRAQMNHNNTSNNSCNKIDASYTSYYSHASDRTANTDVAEPICRSVTDSSFDAACGDPTVPRMCHPMLCNTSLQCPAAEIFSPESPLPDNYPSRTCVQTCGKCVGSTRQSSLLSMSLPLSNSSNMICSCAIPVANQSQLIAGYSCPGIEPVRHPSERFSRNYGQFYSCSASYQETITELLATRTNEVDQNYRLTAGDSQLFRSSQAQTQSASSYFWQYNAQCKGPKALRLIEFDNTTVSGSQISGELDDLSGLLEGNYLATGEPLTSSYAEPYPMEEKDLKLPKLLANSSVSPYSIPNYPLVMFEDPVQRRYDLVHCSKLRRGDGNDVTPNLARLRSMGEELECLNEQLLEHGEIIVSGAVSPHPIAGATSSLNSSMVVLSPTSGLVKRAGINNSTNAAVEAAAALSSCKLVEQAKREKNKLASKICRLKKKAFHEANKIKYTGLELEYNELAAVIVHVKRLISEHLQRANQPVASSSSAVKSSYDASSTVQSQKIDQEASEYAVSSTTGMDDYGRNTRYTSASTTTATNNNRQSSVTAAQPTRGGRTDTDTFDPTYFPASCSTYSLFEQASHLYSTLHVTHAAGRTDALVEEVLRMARDGFTTHPLIKKMAVDGLGGQPTPSASGANGPGNTHPYPGYVQTGTESHVTPNTSVRTLAQSAMPPPPTCTGSNYVTINPPPKFVVPYNPPDGRSTRSDAAYY